MRITVSMGASIYPDDTLDPQELMTFADAAMYNSKKSGRNNFKFYTNQLAKKTKDHLSVSHSLQEAIEKNQFFIVFQPQSNNQMTKVTGMEALLRWVHPSLGYLEPDSFISIAEQSGLMRELSQWVAKEACHQANKLLESGYDFGKVSINVSGSQITQYSLLETIDTALNYSNLPPECLTLEITESYIMRNFDRCIEQLHAIKKMGIEISIDDFGTGYSSLSVTAHTVKK